MKKEFDMSNLVENLASDNEIETPTNRKNKEPKGGKKKVMEHVCTLVDVDQMAKVRTIADREGIALKDIFAAALNLAISNYEQKNGPVRIKNAKKGNVNDVFGL